jgi:translation elongation factor EF-Tu-like GTPase
LLAAGREQDQTVPADNADLLFTLSVEYAFRLTGRGTVIVGVIEQGTVHIGNQLELIQPRGSSTVLLRFQCTGIGLIRATGRDAALGAPIGLMGADIDPDLIEPGAVLRAATQDPRR